MMWIMLLWHCPTIPPVVFSDGASVHGLDGLMVPYPRIPQQQLLPLDQNGYSTDLYRQGLTPPQLPGDHLHPYGRKPSSLCIKTTCSSPNHDKAESAGDADEGSECSMVLGL